MSSDEKGQFTCESCGGTFDKGWSDEEAAAEAQGNFPGINVSDPDEAGVVCDDCYQHIMGRAQAEAPEAIGPGWREAAVPIPDFPGFIAWMVGNGSTLNPCRDGCQDKGTEHVHLRSPDGFDGIVWADGRVSDYDLTQPARLIYPRTLRNVFPRWHSGNICYVLPSGSMVHVKPGCRC